MEPPPIERPAPPKLLAIEHPAEISWQGSAGAASYDVLRADRPSGPWTTVGRDVSDADVQYRSLFSDSTAKPGQAYYYRVVARNEAGDSGPSNSVGPVEVNHRTLVDECADLSAVHSIEGDVAVATENARRTQEDIHRAAMPAGSSIVYRVDTPIDGWRVFAFAPSTDTQPTFATSLDGKQFAVVEAQRQVNPAGQGDYGYLVPIRFDGSAADGSHVFLRISLPESASATSDAHLEISRVEIDYDRRE
jgi:hypothetical protein